MMTLCSGVMSFCTSSYGLLPGSLYFLDGLYEDSQLWRLDADGVTLTRLTAEPGGITAFSVSPKDGSLAYVSGDCLYLADAQDQHQ